MWRPLRFSASGEIGLDWLLFLNIVVVVVAVVGGGGVDIHVYGVGCDKN
jgi:hypothetical protein